MEGCARSRVDSDPASTPPLTCLQSCRCDEGAARRWPSLLPCNPLAASSVHLHGYFAIFAGLGFAKLARAAREHGAHNWPPTPDTTTAVVRD